MKRILISAFVGVASMSLLSLSALASQDVDTNQVSGGSTLTFTNSAGQVFSAAKFADNLKNLRSAIEQTMPMVAAITESQTNAAHKTSSQDKTLTGKVTDFVSGAIKEDKNSSSQSSSGSSKVVGALRGLLKTNSNNTATASTASSSDATTLQHLSQLQSELKSVLPTLDQLNVTTSANGSSANGSVLTPTGR